MKLTRLSYMFSTVHTKFCIIGGGTAGLNVSAHLTHYFKPTDIRIFDKSATHYYQPGFTVIGGGLADRKLAVRPQKDVHNSAIPFTTQNIAKVEADKNLLHTQNGQTYSYDYLIVATGVKYDWQKIKGSKEALKDPKSPISTIYTLEGAEKVAKLGKEFDGKRALFTEPQFPIKCGGAPQKILYLWTQKWQRNAKKPDVQFNKAIDKMFGVPKYSEALAKIAKDYAIDVRFKSKLVEIKKDDKIAVFDRQGTLAQEKFDFLHFVPPMSPPTFLKESGLTDQAGYVNVDKHTMQHLKYPNIWSLGDCSNLPCSKTAAAIFSQTDILVDNLRQMIINRKATEKRYDGYSSCPIFVGHQKLMLAQFKYGNEIAETFYNDQQKPRKIFYYLKKDFFPFIYWNVVPRGRWQGKDGIKFA